MIEAVNQKVKMGTPTVTTPDVLYRERLGSLLDLPDDQKKRLKKFLKKNLRQWEEDTEDRRDNLVADNDLVENVVEETGWPYEGAPNIHMPVASIYMKIFKSVEKRSILGAQNIWHVELEPEAYGTPLEQIAPNIADMMNYKAQNEWNIAQKLEDVLHPTNRDGLGILKVPYVEETEHQKDILIFETPEEFALKFPSPEAAGMTPEVYTETIKTIAAEAAKGENGNPVEIPIEFEKPVYSGPKAKVVELIDFVTFPANCEDLSAEKCKGYGELYTLRKGAVKAKGRDDVWYKGAVDKVLKSRAKSEPNDLKKAQDEIEGVGQSENDEYRFLEAVVRFSLEKDGEEKKLLVTYAPEHDELMAVMEYPYRVDFYALFRIEKRTNRLVGNSIPNQARDINDLIDKQITQRVLSREISTVPSFKAKKSAKGDFDPEAEENRWRPGVIFWLEDPESFDQFKVQPTDLGESMQEEKNAMSMLDLVLGSSASLLSGQAASSDPNAPGNKTAMMINQSNLRMDDPLSTLRHGVDALGDICLSHLYQFGPPEIAYIANADGTQQARTLKKKFLRNGIKMSMSGVNVVDNPESEMNRWMALYAQLVQEPIMAQNVEGRIEILRMALRAGRVPNREKILPTPQQLQEQQVMVAMEAQKRLALEQVAAAAAQEEQRVDQRYNDFKKANSRQKMLESAVDQASGGQANASAG